MKTALGWKESRIRANTGFRDLALKVARDCRVKVRRRPRRRNEELENK